MIFDLYYVMYIYIYIYNHSGLIIVINQLSES